MKKYLTWKLLAILVVTLFLGFFDLPGNIQTKIIPFTPKSIQETKVNLGLDLQGGSQLDYKIDLRKVKEADRQSIIEGVQGVIEKRVNRLGVAEPNIYKSDFAGESHIIVELAETATVTEEDISTYLGTSKNADELTDDEKKFVSLEKAKAAVGKTIQLEFKEEKQEIDPQEKDKIRENAQKTLERIKKGANFSVVGQEEQQAYPEKVKYETISYTFEDDLNEATKSALTKLKTGDSTQTLIESSGNFVINEKGEAVQETGLSILKLLDKKEEVKNKKEVDVSHILISYAGLESADPAITRTAEEAYELAKEITKKLENGADFAEQAKSNSDDKSNKDIGGKLDEPVIGSGTYVYDFEQAALKLEKEGDLSDITKTQFGYHIIKANEIRTDVKQTQYKYDEIEFSTKPDPWKETGLTGEHFIHADVQLDNFFQPYVTIQFNNEGSKLFEEITGRNVNKRIAIFVGGEFISSPTVNEKISGGNAQITGQFTNDEANALARDLNTGAIPAPIVLTGEYTLGATLGQEALNKSLWAGFFGVLLVMIFMIIYYRVPGVVAAVALLIYGIILLFLIKAQLHLGIALLISLGVFFTLTVKIINTEDSGWEKFLSFILACGGLFLFTFLLKSGVVLTLAGIAGLIISFGMAVDANVLIFERIREELRAGNKLQTAIDIGFNRAWSAIRDSNFSSLITCGILYYFGSSIIRGFAFNLAAGILVSMFTAITITKILLYGIARTKMADNLTLLGVSGKKRELSFDFIGRSKIWFGISGATFIISIVAIFAFGLNLGIDFKGGSLLAFQFQEPITKEVISTTMKDSVEKINSEKATIVETDVPPSTGAETQLSESKDQPSTIDISTLQITESGKNEFIVKTNYLTPENHDALLAKIKEKLPKFQETRFTTIGPTLGKTLLNKAIVAGIISIIMIVIYLYIAFRKIPKEINPWRFGASAIVTLIHDVVIIIGIFAILGKFLGVEMDALFATAMLTLFGYSVNDRIVIFDRLRETLTRSSLDDVKDIANKALNETLARSINTSISIFLTMLAILLFGHASIFYFVLALTLGVLIAAYSSIFVAAPLIVYWSTKKLKR
ncbi:MAG: protein translocase subunit SecF [Patescibacteria group bacterium]